MYSRKKKKKGTEKGRTPKPHFQRLTVNKLCFFKNITEKTSLMTHGKCFTCIQRCCFPKDAVSQVCWAVDCNIPINRGLCSLSCY